MNIPSLTANPEANPREFLCQIVQFLGEHFSVAQVFLQIEDGARVGAICSGTGNMFARMKQAEMWLDQYHCDVRHEFEGDREE